MPLAEVTAAPSRNTPARANLWLRGRCCIVWNQLLNTPKHSKILAANKVLSMGLKIVKKGLICR